MRFLVDGLHLFWAGDQSRFMAAPAELIDGLILQVLQAKGVAQDVEFLTCEGVVPFDILGHP